jgi:hypothetical protein
LIVKEYAKESKKNPGEKTEVAGNEKFSGKF